MLTLGADLQRLVGLHQRLLQLGEASLQSLGLLLVGQQLLLQLLPPPAKQCQVVPGGVYNFSRSREPLLNIDGLFPLFYGKIMPN